MVMEISTWRTRWKCPHCVQVALASEHSHRGRGGGVAGSGELASQAYRAAHGYRAVDLCPLLLLASAAMAGEEAGFSDIDATLHPRATCGVQPSSLHRCVSCGQRNTSSDRVLHSPASCLPDHCNTPPSDAPTCMPLVCLC